MKRIITILSFAAVVVASLMCTSCFKEKEQDYKFSYSCQYAIEDEAVVKTVLDYFKTVADGYFAASESHFGTSTAACELAMKGFEEHYKAIDGDYIESLLKEGEYVCLVLTCINNNITVAYIMWTNDSEGTIEEEKE